MDYLADTVIIVRHFANKGKIGKRVKSILNNVNTGSDTLIMSIISFVEILYLSEKSRININFDELRKVIEPLDNYEVVDLNLDIVESAKHIQGLELHDRLIVATAKFYDIPILTSDQEIINYKSVNTIWD
jgi:PIN domain nuclease of toxin-antitoxin system